MEGAVQDRPRIKGRALSVVLDELLDAAEGLRKRASAAGRKGGGARASEGDMWRTFSIGFKSQA